MCADVEFLEGSGAARPRYGRNREGLLIFCFSFFRLGGPNFAAQVSVSGNWWTEESPLGSFFWCGVRETLEIWEGGPKVVDDDC